ncbi:MAG: hypothetical protein AAGF11_50640 [Myxococcota bacterium]
MTTRTWIPLLAFVAGAACVDTPADERMPAATTTSVPETGESGSADTTTTGTPSSDSSSSGSASGCPSPGEPGGQPGQIVPELIVSRCDGSSVSLHDLVCGHPLTLIDIGGAAFDICVDATIAYASDPAYDDLQARGLQIVQIFALDDENQIPTGAFCTEYVRTHAIDFEFAIDQLGATHQLAPVYPFNLVVDAQGTVIHMWEGSVPEDKIAILDSLLEGSM